MIRGRNIPKESTHNNIFTCLDNTNIPMGIPIAYAWHKAGKVSITYLDEQICISRGAADVLRIFVRDEGSESDVLPTW